eukprot:TRINITY_DN93061_c0_g1_i1.p1 TRINITY_DN93061_c0_g1~~TRINITY_DN93061_c0_g1_i1.p1  ORF type:complete len:1481 (+),score=220.36 TRINITY_DN93061_c0_g1_i1:231-4445(+)
MGSGLGAEVVVWDLSTWWDSKPVGGLSQGATVHAVTFSLDSQVVASGTEEGYIYMWRPYDSTEILENARTIEHSVSALQFSANGNWLLGSSSVGAYLWDFFNHMSNPSAEFLPKPPYTSHAMSSAVISADEAFVLTSDGVEVLAWALDLHSPDRSWSMGRSLSQNAAYGNAGILVSPNGNYLVTFQKAEHIPGLPLLSLWDLRLREDEPVLTWSTGAYIYCIEKLPPEGLLMTGLGNRSQNGTWNGELAVWRVPWDLPVANETRTAIPYVDTTAVKEWSYQLPGCRPRALAATPTGGYILCACNSSQLHILEQSSGKVVRVIQLVVTEIPRSIVTFGATSFAIGSVSGSICLHDILAEDSSEPKTCVYPGGSIRALAISADQAELYSGSSNGRLCRWDLANRGGLPIGCYNQPGREPRKILSVVTLPGSKKLVSSSANGVFASWDLDVPEVEQLKPFLWYKDLNYHLRIATSPLGAYIYSTGNQGQISVWFADSMPGYVRRLKDSDLCARTVCSTSTVEVASSGPITMPLWLDATPVKTLALQGAHVESMSPVPPLSLRSVNLSGSSSHSWKSMSWAWYHVPAVIDLRGTDDHDIPVIQGEAFRLATDVDCLQGAARYDNQLPFCVMRAYQTDDELCAKTFVSRDISGPAVVALRSGKRLPLHSEILVDTDKYQAWLCDCPAGRFGKNGTDCKDCPPNFYCPAAGRGDHALNENPRPCPPGSGITRHSGHSRSQCECMPGFFLPPTQEGPDHCIPCSQGKFSGAWGMSACSKCPFGYWPTSVGKDEVRLNICMPDWYGILGLLLLQLGMLHCVWAALRQVVGLEIDDVSYHDEKTILTAAGRHCICSLPACCKRQKTTSKSATIAARFTDTDHPLLDNKPSGAFRLQPLPGQSQFEVLNAQGMSIDSSAGGSKRDILASGTTSGSRRSGADGLKTDIMSRLDTSQGKFHLRFPFVLLMSGRHVPNVVVFTSLMLAALAAFVRAHDDRAYHCLLGIPVTFATAMLIVGFAHWTQGLPTLRKRLLDFKRAVAEHTPEPQPQPRGPGRAVTVQDMKQVLDFFRFLIGDRDMYYVSANILKPMTKETRLSYAEVIGPSRAVYFVSHFWGTEYRHTVKSVVKHAQTAENRSQTLRREPALHWQKAAYWCCSFSNNQWQIAEELGNGDWAQSSFYLALTSPGTQATVMIVDEDAMALTRAWCLFEVLQTSILKSNRQDFEGLLLCTPSGVLNYGDSVSADTALALAQRLATLTLRQAHASNEDDLRMIHQLVESYDGGHEAMDLFVYNTLRRSLMLIKQYHNTHFDNLMSGLRASSGDSLRAPSGDNLRAGVRFATDPVIPIRTELRVHTNGTNGTEDSESDGAMASRHGSMTSWVQSCTRLSLTSEEENESLTETSDSDDSDAKLQQGS